MGISIFFIILLLTPYILVNLTPNLTALYVRKLFEKDIAKYPENYSMYRDKVTVLKDLTYPSQYKNNVFDLYLPKNTGNQSKPLPVIIWVHGGAFVGGDKNGMEIYSTLLASNHYAVLVPNYELAPEAKYPTPLKQLDEFYRYVNSIQGNYPLDMSQVFFAGDSAGAQIASNYVAIQTNSELANQMEIGQAVPRDSIKGALLYCGPYDIDKFNNSSHSIIMKFLLNQIAWSYIGKRNWQDTEEVKQASVVHYVNENYPPAFITDGNTGSFEDHGKELADKLTEHHVEVKTLFFSKNDIETGHEYQFKLDTEPGKKAWEETLFFLKKYSVNVTESD